MPVPSKIRSNGPYLLGRVGYGHVLGRQISCSEFLDQVGIQIRLGSASKRGHIQTFQTQNERRQQTDGAGAHDRSLARAPHLEAALDLVRLVDAFLDDGSRLEQHSDVLEALRHFHDELDIVDVILRQIPVAQVDAALVVGVIRGHIVGADQVINALAWPPYGGYDVVARASFR